MTRTLAGAVQTAVAAVTGELAHLVEIQMSGGTVRLTDAATDLVWSTYTWEASGHLLQLGAISETDDMRAQSMSMKLSGVDQSILSSLLTENYLGRYVIVRRAHINTTTGAIDGVTELFRGIMLDRWTIRSDRGEAPDDPQTVSIETTISSPLAVLQQVRSIRSNLGSHQRLFSGDLFFEFVPHLPTKKIAWGQ